MRFLRSKNIRGAYQKSLPLFFSLYHGNTGELTPPGGCCLQPGTDLHRGKSRRAKAATARCAVQIKLHFCFVCWDKSHTDPHVWCVHDTRILHRDIPYIVSGTTLFRALLLVHFSQCLFERFFSHFDESRAMKGVIFFSFSKFWKGVFVKKKKKI